jgi:hypothetical protein
MEEQKQEKNEFKYAIYYDSLLDNLFILDDTHRNSKYKSPILFVYGGLVYITIPPATKVHLEHRKRLLKRCVKLGHL